MQQRFLYLWLTHWKTDCQRTSQKAQNTPHVITRNDHKGVLVCGLNAAAQKAGLQGGMRLSDARSILPELTDSPEDPALCDGKFARLVRFMDRYSPWIAPDRELMSQGLNGDAGMWLEITGGSHLFGGESAMIKQILRDMKAKGHTARVAIADTAGAAWATAVAIRAHLMNAFCLCHAITRLRPDFRYPACDYLMTLSRPCCGLA